MPCRGSLGLSAPPQWESRSRRKGSGGRLLDDGWPAAIADPAGVRREWWARGTGLRYVGMPCCLRQACAAWKV